MSVTATVSQPRLVVMKFRISGNLRFLSHAQTVTVFHRACFRAGIPLEHSKGFNPRARLSLPLPRSVAVRTDADLLCFRVDAAVLTGDAPAAQLGELSAAEALKSMLQDELPTGCDLLTVSVEQANVSFEPRLVSYAVPVSGATEEEIRDTIAAIMASDKLELERRKDPKTAVKIVNVRPFLKSMEIQGTDIIVNCAYGSQGSIRVGEILALLGIAKDTPVRRTHVEWYKKN